MDMTIDQQLTLDEALVPHASQLRIGKTNFHLRSNITSKESTLQVVYDALRLTPFYKAFFVTGDMNNKKRIVNLEYFREMLHICPRIPNQTFDELSFKEKILAFLRNLGHSREIKKITDEDFVCQVKQKDAKKSNEMYYPRNSTAYKQYYAIAIGAEPPKTKASVRKTQSSFDTTMPPSTGTGIILLTSAKRKQPANSSKAKGLSMLSVVALTKAKQMKLATKRSLQQTHISQASRSSTDEGTSIIPGVLDVPTYEYDEEISWKSSEEDGDDDVDDQSDDDDDDDDQEEAKDEESFNHIFQTPSYVENSDDESNDDESHGMNVRGDEGLDAGDDDKELYGDVNINLKVTTTVEPLLLSAPTLPLPFIPIISHLQQAPAPSPTTAPSTSLYIDHQMNEAIKVVVQLQSDRLQDEAQAENEYFLYKLDGNIQKIIKEQVKGQVKIILDTYGDTVTLKRRRDDEDKDEKPSAGSDRGSKRRRVGKEPESTSAPKEKTSKTSGKSTEGSKSHQKTTSESALAEEQMHTTLDKPSHQEFETGAADDQPVAETSQQPEWFHKNKQNFQLLISLVELEFFLEEVYKATTDQLNWNNPEGQQYSHNLPKPLPLIPNSRGRRIITFDHFINNDLEYLRGGASNRKYTTSVTKTKATDYGYIKWIEDLVPHTMWSQTPAIYDKYALWGISH
nr:hypothetical protein [Tanacetum cinerariifolium]